MLNGNNTIFSRHLLQPKFWPRNTKRGTRMKFILFTTLLTMFARNIVAANDCFSASKLPKALTPDGNTDGDSKYLAITGTMQSLYLGGITESEELIGLSGITGGVITRIDLESSNTVFMKFYSLDIYQIRGLALNPDETQLAVTAQVYWHNSKGNESQLFFIVSALDGRITSTKEVWIDHGINALSQKNNKDYLVTSSSMYWDQHGKIYTAYNAILGTDTYQSTAKDVTEDGTPYEGRLKISKFDVATETYDYFNIQQKWFGRAAALAYLDNGPSGSNLYVGGSSDTVHISDTDQKEWAPSITLIDNDGQLDQNQCWLMKLGAWETDPASHTLIEHMSIDPVWDAQTNVSTNFLFGTTGSSDPSQSGNQFYMFWVELLADLSSLDSDTLLVHKIEGLQADSRVIGVGTNLEFNLKVITALIFVPAPTNQLRYLKGNLSGTIRYEVIFEFISNDEEMFESFFMPEESLIQSAIYVQQSYSVGYVLQLTSDLGSSISSSSSTGQSNAIGVIIPTFRDDTCADGLISSEFDSGNQESTILTTAELLTASTNGDAGVFGPDSQMQISINDKTIQDWSIKIYQLVPDSWCSDTAVYPASTPSTFTLSSACTLGWGEGPVTFPFDPVQFDDSTCNVGNVWNYWLEALSSVDYSQLSISIDGISNEISIDAHADGSGSQNFNFRAHYVPPYGFDSTYYFDFSFNVESISANCLDPVLTAAQGVCMDTNNEATDAYGQDCASYEADLNWCTALNLVDEDFDASTMCCCCGAGGYQDDVDLYYTRFDPLSSYEVEPFVTNPVGCLIIYNAESLPSEIWIVLKEDTGRGMEWQADSDVPEDTTYVITVTSTAGCTSPLSVKTIQFTLKVLSRCRDDQLFVDQNETVFIDNSNGDTTRDQYISYSPHAITWTDDLAYSTLGITSVLAGCGELTWTLTTQAGDIPDPTLFTIDTASSTKSLSVYSNDMSKTGTYSFSLVVNYSSCFDKLLPSGLHWKDDDNLTCEDWRTQGIDLESGRCEGIEQGTTASEYCCGACGGGISPENHSNQAKDFDISLIDPCFDAIISIDASQIEQCQDTEETTDVNGFTCKEYYGSTQNCGVGDQPGFIANSMCCACNGGLVHTSPAEIIYGIGENIVSLDFSQSFESSETSGLCPDLQLIVTNDDDTALEADKFEYDPSIQVLFVLTSDISLRGVYDIKMYVRYPGAAYDGASYAQLNISADLHTCTSILFGFDNTIADTEYMIGDPMLTTSSFDLTCTTFPPTYTITYTSNGVTESVAPPFITFNEGTTSFDISSTDITVIAIYTVAITAEITVTSGDTFDISTSFDLTIYSSCYDWNLTLDPTMLVSNEIVYHVQYPDEEVVFDLAKVTNLETTDGCSLIGAYQKWVDGEYKGAIEIRPLAVQIGTQGGTHTWRYVSDDTIRVNSGQQWRLGDGVTLDPSTGMIEEETSLIKDIGTFKTWLYDGPLQSTPFTSAITNQDGTAADSGVFSFTSNTDYLDLTITTDSFSQAGPYPLKFTVENSGYDNLASLDFLVVVVDPCYWADLTIQNSIVDSHEFELQIDYSIWYEEHVQLLDRNKVISNETTALCPDVVFEFKNTDDGLPLDSSVFGYNAQTLELSIFTQDVGTVGHYPITMTTYNEGYTNSKTLDFAVVLTDNCIYGNLTIDETILTSLEIHYSIWYETNVQFLNLTKVSTNETVAVCPTVVYDIINRVDPENIVEEELLIDPDLFTYNPATLQLMTFTEDFDKVGEYKMTLTAYNEGYENFRSMNFTIVIDDPCEVALLDLSQITSQEVFHDTITYIIGEASVIINLDQSSITSNETTAECPSIVLEVTNDNGSPLDSTVFTYSQTTNLFEIACIDTGKVDDYTLRITAFYEGYDNYATYPFVTHVIDANNPCISAILTISPSILPEVIQYSTNKGTAIQYLLDQESVQSTVDATIICPYIEFNVISDDHTALNSTLFAFDSHQNMFQVECHNDTYVGSYGLLVTAKYAGFQYLENRAELFFEVEIKNATHSDSSQNDEGSVFVWNFDTNGDKDDTNNISVVSGRPVPTIISMNTYGEVIVKFNSTMVPPYDLESTRRLVDIYEGEQPSSFKNFSKINNGTVVRDGQVIQAVEVQVMDIDQSQDEEHDQINFSWECIQFTSSTMTILIDFVQPNQVSSGKSAQILQIVFNDESTFRDIHNNTVAGGFVVHKNIPRQIDKDIGDAIETLTKSVGAGFSVTFISSFFFVGSLNIVFAAIKNLQILTHIFLVNVGIPSNAQLFFKSLLNIAAFDFVEQIAEFRQDLDVYKLMSIEPPTSEPLSGNFEALGYESASFIHNFGSLFIFYIVYPIYVITLVLVRRISRKYSLKTFCKATNLLQDVFFNQIIKFTEETYMITVICCFIRFHQLFYREVSFDYGFFCAMFALVIILVYPLFVLRLRCHTVSKLKDPATVRTIGTIYKNLNFEEHGISAMIYPLMQISRKTILGFALVFGNNYPNFQLMTINFQGLFMLISSGWLEPFNSYHENVQELFNEGYVLFAYYHLACMTDFVSNTTIREELGFSMIILTCFNILVSLIKVLTIQIHNFRMYIMKKLSKRKVKNAMKKNFQKRLTLNINSVAVLVAQPTENQQSLSEVKLLEGPAAEPCKEKEDKEESPPEPENSNGTIVKDFTENDYNEDSNSKFIRDLNQMLDQPLELELDIKREQQDLDFIAGSNMSLTSWMKSKQSDVTRTTTFHEVLSHEELRRRVGYILKTILLKHYQGKWYNKTEIVSTNQVAIDEIIRRSNEEISLAYSYVPQIMIYPKTTINDIFYDSPLCEGEKQGQFIKEYEINDFYVTCLIDCNLKQ